MSSDTDRLLDRRTLKRSLIFWRVVGVVAIVAVLGVSVFNHDVLPEDPYVAMLDVNGVIFTDDERDDLLEDMITDDKVKALIVRIDSPGGTFVGGEALYLSIRELAATKPVVAVIGNVGTSAAYMAAIGTQRIFASTGSITASIGVIMQSANVSGLLEKLGVEPLVVKSGDLKAQPNPMEPFTPAAQVMVQGVIADLHDIFVAMVAERRNLSPEDALLLSDGRIMTGRQAITASLVDEIGGKNEARNWLTQSAGIDAELALINVTPIDEVDRWSHAFSIFMGKTLFSERLSLDGALSLWHPQLNL